MLQVDSANSLIQIAPVVRASLIPDTGSEPRSRWLQRLLEKIETAPFETEPFRHLYIPNFLAREHFARIVSAPEIAVPGLKSDEQLFDSLFKRGYKIIDFPGCITNREAYIKWHGRKAQPQRGFNNSACKGFGITLRLLEAQSPIMKELVQFMESDAFQNALTRKFGVDRSAVTYDGGVQKYLDGYEISPHPDTRKKALTYMVNVDPGMGSEMSEHHSHYLRLKEKYQYVRAYWDGNPDEDRCWVPWNWCDTIKQQRENNSIVVFAPDNTTMHAVRARYDHLATQRTQLHGDFWYRADAPARGPEWEDFVIHKSNGKLKSAITRKLKAAVPGVTRFIKDKILRRGDNVVIRGDRWKKVIG